jgi:hypothetical protein
MNLTRTSKYVSLLLRHKPEKAGIHLDQHGWAEVDELIKDGMVQERNMFQPLMNKDFFTKTDYMFTYQRMKKPRSKLENDTESQFYIL